MSNKRKQNERNGHTKSSLPSVWSRALTPCSEWPDKDEFLDVLYWSRQILGILLGLAWGLVPLKGFLGITLFCCVNTFLVYGYTSSFQKVDDEEYGGVWELAKEGFMTSFAGFLVTWIMIYSATQYD
ncbi:GEL complex subunit OPTI-like [Ornithodoros turicata]|uniref:Putative rab5-interacting protein n=1 Tax=Ornithodoros turicata TaxID=34597 RepID=A0A2R5LGC5_9ACAR